MENHDAEKVPREQRTPITEAGSAIAAAWEFYCGFVETLKKFSPDLDREFSEHAESEFLDMYRAVWEDAAADGDKATEKLFRLAHGNDDERTVTPFLVVVEIVVSYGVQAMKADESGQHDLAWTYAADAKYWAGVLTAAWNDRLHGEKPAAALAKRRHAENEAMKADALKFWRENIDPALSAARAANELLRVVPLSHKKLSELVSAAKKANKKSDS